MIIIFVHISYTPYTESVYSAALNSNFWGQRKKLNYQGFKLISI